MSEPLKNKVGYIDDWQVVDEGDTHPSSSLAIFNKKDVLSAVKWLKRELKEPTNKRYHNLFDVIDEAFEDATKK